MTTIQTTPEKNPHLLDARVLTVFLALLTLILSAPVAASTIAAKGPITHDEQPAGENEASHTVIKRLRHRIAGDMVPHIRVFPIHATEDDDANALILTGAKDQVVAAAKLLEALDVPTQSQRTYELIVTILRATPDGTVQVSDRLKGVVDRLLEIFPYRGYKTEDVILARIAGGRSFSARGTIVGGDPYSFEIRHLRVDDPSEGETERRLFLSDVGFSLRHRTENFTKASFSTSVELREGQIAVVGKATTQTTSGELGALVLLVEMTPAE